LNRGIEQYHDKDFKFIPVEEETLCYVKDLEGSEYPLQATTSNEYDLNSNQALSFSIMPSGVNDLFIDDIAEMWNVIDHDGVEHKIIYAKKQGSGERLTVNVKAIPLFFDKFSSDRIYETFNQSLPADTFFNIVFGGSGFDFVLVDSFNALEWEGLGGGTTRLEMFKNGLNRYKAEFRIEGNTIYLESQIGRDTNFMYRYKLNASNISMENDASNFWTYAKGFGDYDEGDESSAKLIREYTSPLAQVIGIRHAPPIYDGRIKSETTMDNALKELVDSSLKISVTATIHDLVKQGYDLGQPQLGDRTFLIDERIGLNDEVRINHLTKVRDWKGNILDIQAIFGSQSLSKRYQSDLNTGIKRITDIVEGRASLPYNVLPNAIKIASEALRSAMTELEFNNGIIARDTNDPNRLVLYNSAGLGISLDGGMTFEEAITYLGINTNLLTAGDIHTNNIRIVGDSNYFFWDGTGLQAIDPNDINKFVRLRSDGLYISRGAITIEREDGFKAINNGVPTGDFAVQGANPPFRDTTDVNVRGQWIDVSSSARRRVDRYTFQHTGRYIRFAISRYVAPGGGAQGVIYIEDNTTGEELWNLTFDNDSNHNSAQFIQEYNVDIGTPTGNRKSVVIRARTTIAGYPVSLHIASLSIWG
jgi:hypothetical protein